MNNIGMDASWGDFVGRPIICYRLKSGGVIMGEFECLKKFAVLESQYRMPYIKSSLGKDISSSVVGNIYSILKGRSRYMKSHHFNCDITIKFKKAI